jgi:hypothetical protein
MIYYLYYTYPGTIDVYDTGPGALVIYKTDPETIDVT